MESHWIHSRPGYRCRHGHTGPRTDDRPAILYVREDRLITRIGRALHLPAAASPRTVADRIRTNQAVVVCHADKVDIKGRLTTSTWENENHTGSFSALENDPVW